jgi:uncharacterized protein (DUF362 family)
MGTDRRIDRRNFVIQSAKTAGVIAGASLMPGLIPRVLNAADAPPDISVVTGTDYFKATIQAIEKLGGIGRFVSSGDTVGLLCNIFSKKPGTYTRPDVMLAVAHLCYEAGAKQVYGMKNEKEKYWRRSPVSANHKALIARIKPDDSDHKMVKIAGTKSLAKMNILEGTFKYDKLINIPIIKNHSGVSMTCNLKNMMGLTSFRTNIKFHLGEKYVQNLVKELGNFFYDMDWFSQCVADLNRVRKVDLCVVDATEFITTNGPSGPGEISRPNQIVAGTDPVAIDAFCAKYLNLNPADIGMIQKAEEAKIGRQSLDKLSILKTTI